jgi:RNA polymerase sigma-70 factor (ECF subfamily)
MEGVATTSLATKLCRYAAGGVESPPEQAAAIEARLFAILAAGRAAWPELSLSDDDFLRYLGERLPEEARLPEALEGVNAPDLHLACCCALQRPRALEAFERHCFASLPAVLSRFSTLDDFHDEVRQAVRERLFVVQPGGRARIEDYAGRGSLGGWVRVVAVRLAVDLLRQRGKQPPTVEDDILQTLATGADPELRILAERYREEVKAAFRESFAALSAAERNLLRLHHIDGLTIDDLAAMKRVHRSTVARRIARCCEQVAAHTHRVLVERLGIAPSQVDSVMRLVRSQLDLSLDRWLAKSPASRR